MGRAPCCDKANVKRGPWSPEEDATLKSYIEQNGTGGNWIALPQKIGLKRCGKSCRLRWLNYLRPNIKHGGFSEEEDNIICSLYISIGSRWSIIASRLEGRTDNDIKNYWNTKLKKKLLGKQRKDQHQGRRACRAKMQEGKAVEGGTGGCNRSTGYWADPPVPIYPISKKEPIVDDGQASIRKLLIKLGGRFSGDDGASHPSPFAVPQQALYDESTMAPPTNPTSFMDCLQDPAGFPTELGEMFRSNSLKLDGLDCLYGAENVVVDGSGSMPSSSESTNWSGVSPLIYPPPLSGYQGMDQCLLEYPVHLEMQ